MSEIGFNKDGERIQSFTAKCNKCGSNNVSIHYEFNYYGGYTGWDMSMSIECDDCKKYEILNI